MAKKIKKNKINVALLHESGTCRILLKLSYWNNLRGLGEVAY